MDIYFYHRLLTGGTVMSKNNTTQQNAQYHGSVHTYIIGFVGSVIFTLAAYYMVVSERFSYTTALTAITILAVAQLLIQLVFFLHLGKESKPRWNAMVFSFMLLVVGIVVIGSIWVMNNLHYNMMPSQEIDKKMEYESQKGF